MLSDPYNAIDWLADLLTYGCAVTGSSALLGDAASQQLGEEWGKYLKRSWCPLIQLEGAYFMRWCMHWRHSSGLLCDCNVSVIKKTFWPPCVPGSAAGGGRPLFDLFWSVLALFWPEVSNVSSNKFMAWLARYFFWRFYGAHLGFQIVCRVASFPDFRHKTIAWAGPAGLKDTKRSRKKKLKKLKPSRWPVAANQLMACHASTWFNPPCYMLSPECLHIVSVKIATSPIVRHLSCQPSRWKTAFVLKSVSYTMRAHRAIASRMLRGVKPILSKF